ncbi:hypothetical protein MMC17_008730 [Xylographa soralifera]|nr:hypothetical protein [Xylographa soralifera]
MQHNSFMKQRAKPIALGIVLLLLTLFLFARLRDDGIRPLHSANGLPVKAIDAAINKLERHLPMGNASEFAQKGGRVAKLADIVTLLRYYHIPIPKRFNTLVQREFPWWIASNLETAFAQSTRDIGIVVCVGSNNIITAGHLILSLRNVLEYKLAIQIAYAGDDDLTKKNQAALLRLSYGLELLNLPHHFNQSAADFQDGKYAMKPFAAIASRFRMTILVDADVIFLKNPDTIFQEHDMVAVSGALFYHDRAYKMEGNSRKAWVQSLLGNIPPSSTLQNSLFWKEDLWQEMESGVVAFDKGHPRIIPSLLFSAWMNTKYVREHETYVHVLGDKETYWLAMVLSNTSYYFQPEYAGLIGTIDSTAGTSITSKICSAHILHMDRTGDTPFWFNGGLLLNKALNGMELANLTHFITGGTNMSDQPAWRYDGNEYWCTEGKPAIALSEKKMDAVLGKILQEARKVEEVLAISKGKM